MYQNFRNGRPFTPAEDAVLRREWGQGRSAMAIAADLGRSASSVSKRAQRLGLCQSRKVLREKAFAERKKAGTSYRPLHSQLRNEPLGVTANDMVHSSFQETACRLHLVDLMREFAPGLTVGEAKAAYRNRCEFYVPEGADKPAIYATWGERSYCGSPAATCAG